MYNQEKEHKMLKEFSKSFPHIDDWEVLTPKTLQLDWIRMNNDCAKHYNLCMKFSGEKKSLFDTRCLNSFENSKDDLKEFEDTIDEAFENLTSAKNWFLYKPLQ